MAKRNKQTEFQGKHLQKPKDWFGGSSLTSNPKTSRPLSSKLPLHIVLRSGLKTSMRKPATFGLVNGLVRKTADKYGVKIYEYANVGNHLHILVKIPHIRVWAAFIRELTGRISQNMQNLRGRAKGEKFWSGRPFTRVVQGWRKAYRFAKDYVILNRLEGEGVIRRDEIKRLSELNELFGWRVT